jgi:hypothetical protein
LAFLLIDDLLSDCTYSVELVACVANVLKALLGCCRQLGEQHLNSLRVIRSLCRTWDKEHRNFIRRLELMQHKKPQMQVEAYDSCPRTNFGADYGGTSSCLAQSSAKVVPEEFWLHRVLVTVRRSARSLTPNIYCPRTKFAKPDLGSTKLSLQPFQRRTSAISHPCIPLDPR